MSDDLSKVADKLAVIAELMAIESDGGDFPLLQAAETRRGVHLILAEATATLRAAADTD